MVARHPSEAATDEEATVYLRRFKEARRAGMSRLEAQLFAESEIDVGELRRLVRLGCPAGMVAALLL